MQIHNTTKMTDRRKGRMRIRKFLFLVSLLLFLDLFLALFFPQVHLFQLPEVGQAPGTGINSVERN
jgi:hypothetical protein